MSGEPRPHLRELDRARRAALDERGLGEPRERARAGRVALAGAERLCEREPDAGEAERIEVAGDRRGLGLGERNDGLGRPTASERDAARLAFQSALTLRERLLGPDRPDLGPLLVSLGELALESGGLDESEAVFSRAIALYTADPAHPHFDLPSARAGLGRAASRSPWAASTSPRLASA